VSAIETTAQKTVRNVRAADICRKRPALKRLRREANKGRARAERAEARELEAVTRRQEAAELRTELLDSLREDMCLDELKGLVMSYYYDRVAAGARRTPASALTADVFNLSPKTVIKWRDDWENDGSHTFTASRQGKHVKTPWLLESEDLQLEAKQYVRENANRVGQPNMTCEDFAAFFNESLLPKVQHTRYKILDFYLPVH
jgi:hypothetical protein